MVVDIVIARRRRLQIALAFVVIGAVMVMVYGRVVVGKW